jgi:pimeloyl-ACP methyl ester carboxylesterase
VEPSGARPPGNRTTTEPGGPRPHHRDLLPRIAVPTLLIWGELDARSSLNVAHQFEQAIPDTTLVVIQAPVT